MSSEDSVELMKALLTANPHHNLKVLAHCRHVAHSLATFACPLPRHIRMPTPSPHSHARSLTTLACPLTHSLATFACPQVVVDTAKQYSESLTPETLIALFEGAQSYDGLFHFLGAIVNASTDPEVHFKYIEAAANLGKVGGWVGG